MRRNFSRKKRRVSTRKVPKATKKYVLAQISKKQESKMAQFSDNLFWNEEPTDSFNPNISFGLWNPISVGVTDRGRIGNEIWATKISCMYKISADWVAGDPELPDLLVPIEGLAPLVFKMFLIKRKANLAGTREQWFKAKDRGQEYPFLPMTLENVQNGRNKLNTDFYDVVATKNVTVRLTRDKRREVITGQFNYRWKKPIKVILNQNNTEVNNTFVKTPLYDIIIYPYWGSSDSGWGGQWGIETSTMMYYKD